MCRLLIGLLILMPIFSIAQKDAFKARVAFTVPVELQIISSGQNGEETWEEKSTKQHTINLSVNDVEVKVNGLEFNGIGVSNPFFVYKNVTRINGKFNKEKTKIESMTIVHNHILNSGDVEGWYSYEKTTYVVKLSNLEINRSGKEYTVGVQHGKIDNIVYSKRTFEQRYFNRNETYLEYANGVSPTKTFYGSAALTILGDLEIKSDKPFSVRIVLNSLEKNKDEIKYARGYSGVLISKLSSLPGVKIYDNTMRDKQKLEQDLSEAGISDLNLNNERIEAADNANVDLTITFSSTATYDDSDVISQLFLEMKWQYSDVDKTFVLPPLVVKGSYNALVDFITVTYQHELTQFKQTL